MLIENQFLNNSSIVDQYLYCLNYHDLRLITLNNTTNSNLNKITQLRECKLMLITHS